MSPLQIKALLAGIFLGVWPLLINKSGLNGNISSLALTAFMFVCIFPFAIKDVGDILSSNWIMLIGAGVSGTIGIILFNGMLASASSKEVGSLFIMMIVAQITIPAVYNIALSGGITITKGLGFMFAIVTAILLSR